MTLPLTLLLRRGGNLTLLHFLLGLKTAPDDELVAELVVSILRVCPDLLHKYLKEVTFSFLPRATATWANNVRLLRRVRLRMGSAAGEVAVSPACGTPEVSGCGPSPRLPFPELGRGSAWESLRPVSPFRPAPCSGSESP